MSDTRTAGQDDIMPVSSLRPLLALSKHEPVSCALGITKEKNGILLLNKLAKPKRVLADLKKQAAKIKLNLDTPLLRFGHASIDSDTDPALILFTINKEPPGALRPKLLEHLKKAGFSKVEFHIDESLEADSEEETPPPVQDDGTLLHQALVTLAGRIKALDGGDQRRGGAVKLAGAASEALKGGDLEQARALLGELTQALQGPTTPGGNQEGGQGGGWTRATPSTTPGQTTPTGPVMGRQRSGAVSSGTPPRVEPPRGELGVSPSEIYDANRRTGLGNPGNGRNVLQSRQVATRLIGPGGTVLTTEGGQNLMQKVSGELKTGNVTGTPQGKHLLKTLKLLEDDPLLRTKLESIGKPKPDNPATGLIRATLGLAPDVEVTEVHARQAALAAMASELRQNDVGSCFGTSVAIHIHNRQPGKMLDDLKEMIETGKVTRDVPGLGPIAMEVPQQMSRAELETRKMKTAPDGTMSQVDGKPLTPPALLADAPPVQAALTALGLPAEAIPEALAAIGKSQALDRALAALPSTLTPEQRTAVVEAIQTALGKGTPLPDAVQAAIDQFPALSGGAGTAALNAANAPAPTELDITPDTLIRQLAMNQAGVNESDMRLYAQMQDVAKKWRVAQQEDTRTDPSNKGSDGFTPEFKTLNEEYMRLSEKLTGARDDKGKPVDNRLSKIVGMQQTSKSAEDAYLGSNDNRLLRSWEYMVAGMAEQGVAKRHDSSVKAGPSKALGDALGQESTKAKTRKLELEKQPVGSRSKQVNDEVAALGKSDEIATKLSGAFKTLFDERISLEYDASIVHASTSGDGNSGRGGFTLLDKTLPDQPTQIKDQKSFGQVVAGLLLDAWVQEYGDDPNPEMQKLARKMAEEVAAKAGTDAFRDASNQAQLEDYTRRGLDATPTSVPNPWTVARGNFSENLLPVYFEQDPPTINRIKPANSTELGAFVVNQAKRLWPSVQDQANAEPDDAGVPMGGGPHAFIMRPGTKSMKAACQGGKTGAEVVQGEVDKATAQGDTPLTAELLEDIVGDMNLGKNTATVLNLLRQAMTGGKLVRDLPAMITGILKAPKAATVDALHGAASLAAAKQVTLPAKGRDAMQDQMLAALDHLPLTDEQKTAVRRSVIGEMDDMVSGLSSTDLPNLQADMAGLSSVLGGALTGAGVTGIDKKAIRAAIRGKEPPGLVFADTNWGDSDHRIMFTMLASPMGGPVKLYQVNHDGTGLSAMKEADWVDGKAWNMPDSVASCGGA